MSDTVRFELLGGTFKTFFGRDKNGKKLYFDPEKAKLAGVREEAVIRYKDGTPVGFIELSTNGTRILVLDRDETPLIEALKNHELCLASKNKSEHAKLRFVDDDEVKAKTKGGLELKKKATLVWYNLEDNDKADFAVVMGYGTDDVVIEDKATKLIETKPETFLKYFTEPSKDKGLVKAKLKEKYTVEATVKRALTKRIVTMDAGSIKFEDKVLGSSLEIAVTNLMNTNKGDDKAFAFILPLIVEKLG